MNQSNKAVLLSALVFPGAGHFKLKKYIPGTVLACASLAALYLIIADMLKRAMEVSDKILSGEVSPDVATISQLISSQSGSETQQLDIAWAVLIVSWLIGIVDSYRCGKAQEKNNGIS